jgi:hypothetical protein
MAGTASIDLSKAMKLKDVVFRPEPRRVEWVITALQTITPKHQDLQQITIHLPYCLALPVLLTNLRQTIGEVYSEKWLDLNQLLVQFWEACSIRPKIIFPTDEGMEDIGYLLPEITKRRVIDIFEY